MFVLTIIVRVKPDLLHQEGLVDTKSQQHSNRKPEAFRKVISCEHPHHCCHGNIMDL